MCDAERRHTISSQRSKPVLLQNIAITHDQVKTTSECHLVAHRAGQKSGTHNFSPSVALDTGCSLIFIPLSCKGFTVSVTR